MLERGLLDPFEIINVRRHDHGAMIDLPEQSTVPVGRAKRYKDQEWN